MSFEVSLHHRLGERTLSVDFASSARLTALVGASGIGKTSVLNALAGLLRPDTGRIVANGRVLCDPASAVDLPPEARGAGYVFQDARLFPHMRVGANLAYGAKRAADRADWLSRDEIVDLLDIAHLLHRWPANLSGGETRRVAIGRALLSGPDFLLLDEPFAGLDPDRADTLRALVMRIRDALEVPILLVSHDAAEVERLAGEVVTMG